MSDAPGFRPGDVVRCRLTGQTGRIRRTVTPDPSGRRHYIDWEGECDRSFSLMGDGQLLLVSRNAEEEEEEP